MHSFFSPDKKSLDLIVKKTLKNQDVVKKTSVIQTGWTNITLDVSGENRDYIFRFPRNLFFSKMMIKDCTFCQFVRQKVSFPIPDMRLCFDEKKRPFSMHSKIKGVSLTERMNHLSPSEQTQLAEDLASFLSQLHAIPVITMPVPETLNDFLTGLASVHKGNYDLSTHSALKQMESSIKIPVIVHGDFNPGNVLLNEEGRLAGVIDFAFASISDRHADLGRFVGRSPEPLGQALVKAYQEKTLKPCDHQKIKAVVDLFQYVEYKYVDYMQRSHPEIIIPRSVLDMASAYEGHSRGA